MAPPSDGVVVLEGVPRDLPRKLNVGRARNGRCVDVTCADVSIAFSSGFFSSDIDEAVVDRRLKRLRAKMYKFMFSPHQFKCEIGHKYGKMRKTACVGERVGKKTKTN